MRKLVPLFPFLLMLSCSKSDQINDSEIMQQMDVKSKLATLKTGALTGKNMTTVANAVLGQEEINKIGSSVDLSNDDFLMDDNTLYDFEGGPFYGKVYVGRIEILAPYQRRNLIVHLTIPFEYTVNNERYHLTRINSPLNSNPNPILTFDGFAGEIVNVQVNNFLNPLELGSFGNNSTDGSASYVAGEKRTIIVTSTGSTIISSGFNAEIFTVGSQLSDGSTVTSSTNEMGTHTGDVTYQLSCSNITAIIPPLSVPAINRYYVLRGAFYGTIDN